MTYNVHGFVGTDKVYDPERIARVIESSGPTVVALQEVDFGRGPRFEPAAIERVAERLGMRCHFTFAREGKNGHFGNAVLSPYALRLIAEGPLPRHRDEGRAVQWLEVAAETFKVQLINTHLSIRRNERRRQVSALLGAEWMAKAEKQVPLVVCGDLNASPLSGVYRTLGRELVDVQRGRPGRRATWPSRMPFWRIDHMFVGPGIEVSACAVVDDRLARSASDHLPLVADLVVMEPSS
jgi:endonuclease/exonuclease/phosphatase family metal-dependent hydrolase